jgi:hypothetical protein
MQVQSSMHQISLVCKSKKTWVCMKTTSHVERGIWQSCRPELKSLILSVECYEEHFTVLSLSFPILKIVPASWGW